MNTERIDPRDAAGTFADERGEVKLCPPSPAALAGPWPTGAIKGVLEEAKAKVPKANKVRSTCPPRKRARAKPDKLVCRRCCRDDLSPSFKKTRDRRSRALFKERWRAKYTVVGPGA